MASCQQKFVTELMLGNILAAVFSGSFSDLRIFRSLSFTHMNTLSCFCIFQILLTTTTTTTTWPDKVISILSWSSMIPGSFPQLDRIPTLYDTVLFQIVNTNFFWLTVHLVPSMPTNGCLWNTAAIIFQIIRVRRQISQQNKLSMFGRPNRNSTQGKPNLGLMKSLNKIN